VHNLGGAWVVDGADNLRRSLRTRTVRLEVEIPVADAVGAGSLRPRFFGVVAVSDAAIVIVAAADDEEGDMGGSGRGIMSGGGAKGANNKSDAFKKSGGKRTFLPQHIC
jgi:hypothetical protein